MVVPGLLVEVNKLKASHMLIYFRQENHIDKEPLCKECKLLWVQVSLTSCFVPVFSQSAQAFCEKKKKSANPALPPSLPRYMKTSSSQPSIPSHQAFKTPSRALIPGSGREKMIGVHSPVPCQPLCMREVGRMAPCPAAWAGIEKC